MKQLKLSTLLTILATAVGCVHAPTPLETEHVANSAQNTLNMVGERMARADGQMLAAEEIADAQGIESKDLRDARAVMDVAKRKYADAQDLLQDVHAGVAGYGDLMRGVGELVTAVTTAEKSILRLLEVDDANQGPAPTDSTRSRDGPGTAVEGPRTQEGAAPVVTPDVSPLEDAPPED
jgi:hypothetical protein